MLSRIAKSVMWASTIFENSVAASSNLSAGINQTPLNLANPVRIQSTLIELDPPVAQATSSFYQARNGQTNIDGLAPYLEYIFAAAFALPVAVMVYLGYKKVNRAARSYQRKPPTIPPLSADTVSPKPAVSRRPRQASAQPPSGIFSPSASGSPGTRANFDTELTPRKRAVFAKTSMRQLITQTIREKIEQRREAAAAAKKNEKLPVSIKVKSLPPKPAIVVSPAASSVARVSTALKATPPASNSGSPVLPKRKTLQAQLELVRESATELAKFSERFYVDAEEKMDDAALRVKYLLGMYCLHRYNLSVLELMHQRPAFHTEQYATLIVPLRLEFAHFSNEISPRLIAEVLEILRADLAHFLEIQSQLSTTSLRHFIENMNQHLLCTGLVQRCLARLPETRARTIREKNSQAHAAYQEFVNVSLPQMQVLAEKILSLPESASEDQDFSYAEHVQAFGMLVMQSCDRLPVHILMRLRNSTEDYSDSIILLMSKVHNLRNTVAHRLEALPLGAVRSLCERVGRVCHELQDDSSARPPRRDSLAGRFFGTGSAREGVVSSSVVATSQKSMPRQLSQP